MIQGSTYRKDERYYPVPLHRYRNSRLTVRLHYDSIPSPLVHVRVVPSHRGMDQPATKKRQEIKKRKENKVTLHDIVATSVLITFWSRDHPIIGIPKPCGVRSSNHPRQYSRSGKLYIPDHESKETPLLCCVLRSEFRTGPQNILRPVGR